MYCIACGKNLGEGDAFCYACGVAVVPDSQGTLAHSRRSALGIASLVVGLIALALAIVDSVGAHARLGILTPVGWSLFATVAAFSLGIAGAAQKGRKRLHASLGMYLATGTLGVLALGFFVRLILLVV